MTNLFDKFIIIMEHHDKWSDEMIITFIGHSKLKSVSAVESALREVLEKYISPENRITFYCGGYGDFDLLCARVVRDMKRNISNCESILVIPYLNRGKSDIGSLYDQTLYPPFESVPLKFAILKRNEWMIDESDVVIAFVEFSFGGASKSLAYAKRKNKTIVNLADEC